jgi:hypothetical protein
MTFVREAAIDPKRPSVVTAWMTRFTDFPAVQLRVYQSGAGCAGMAGAGLLTVGLCCCAATCYAAAIGIIWFANNDLHRDGVDMA